MRGQSAFLGGFLWRCGYTVYTPCIYSIGTMYIYSICSAGPIGYVEVGFHRSSGAPSPPKEVSASYKTRRPLRSSRVGALPRGRGKMRSSRSCGGRAPLSLVSPGNWVCQVSLGGHHKPRTPQRQHGERSDAQVPEITSSRTRATPSSLTTAVSLTESTRGMPSSGRILRIA